LKGLQNITQEKVIARLGGTSFLTDTGKVIEGDYTVGEYAPVIFDKMACRFIPVWKKDVGIGEPIAKRVEDEYAGGSYTVYLYGSVVRYDAEENKIFWETVSQNDNYYIDLDGVVVNSEETLMLRVVEYRSTAGVLIYKDTSDYYWVVKFELTGITDPREEYEYEGDDYLKCDYVYGTEQINLSITVPGGFNGFAGITLVNISDPWIENLVYGGIFEQEVFLELKNVEVYLEDIEEHGVNNIRYELFASGEIYYGYHCLLHWPSFDPGDEHIINDSFTIRHGFYNRGSGWDGAVNIFAPTGTAYLGITQYAWKHDAPWYRAYKVYVPIEKGEITFAYEGGHYCVSYCDEPWKFLETYPIFDISGSYIAGWFVNYYSMLNPEYYPYEPNYHHKWFIWISVTDFREVIMHDWINDRLYGTGTFRPRGGGIMTGENKYRCMETKSFFRWSPLTGYSLNLYVINDVVYLESSYSDGDGETVIEPKEIPEDEMGSDYPLGRCAKELQLASRKMNLEKVPGIYDVIFRVYWYGSYYREEHQFRGKVIGEEALTDMSRYHTTGTSYPMQVVADFLSDFGLVERKFAEAITYRY